MGQRQHSMRKVQTPDVGVVQIMGSFPSGAQEDGSFPDSALDDGYVARTATAAPNDAYGAGFKGVIRVAVGRYDIILDRVYPELMHACGSVQLETTALVQVQLDSPVMTTASPAGGDVSVVHMRIVGSTGIDTDLAAQDRVSFHLDLRNTSV